MGVVFKEGRDKPLLFWNINLGLWLIINCGHKTLMKEQAELILEALLGCHLTPVPC